MSTMTREEAIEFLESKAIQCGLDGLHRDDKLYSQCAALLADDWQPMSAREWADGDEAILMVRKRKSFIIVRGRFELDCWWADDEADGYYTTSVNGDIFGFRPLNLPEGVE